MGKLDLISELLALRPADQKEILELLQARVSVDAVKSAAGETGGEVVVVREGKRGDPWGSVYQELTKTFRRPATP